MSMGGRWDCGRAGAQLGLLQYVLRSLARLLQVVVDKLICRRVICVERANVRIHNCSCFTCLGFCVAGLKQDMRRFRHGVCVCSFWCCLGKEVRLDDAAVTIKFEGRVSGAKVWVCKRTSGWLCS